MVRTLLEVGRRAPDNVDQGMTLSNRKPQGVTRFGSTAFGDVYFAFEP